MILSAAVIFGLLAGLTRSNIGKRPYRTVPLRYAFLVPAAFIPQWVVFNLSRTDLPNLGGFGNWAPLILVATQALLLAFAWVNRRQPGFWLLGLGLALNFLVIVTNGGLMPISPEMVRAIYPGAPDWQWSIGQRLGNGKDIVLAVSQTRFELLADRFTFPPQWGLRVAFSLGDVLIAAGAFNLLWSLGGPGSKVDSKLARDYQQRSNNEHQNAEA